MSEPAEEFGPPAPPAPEPPPPKPPRHIGALAAIAAIAGALVIVAIAATPFWAPGIMRLLPWGTSTTKSQPTSTVPDSALVAVRAQASQNTAALQQLTQRMAALEAKPVPAPADLSPIEQQVGALKRATADLSDKVAAVDKAEREHSATDPKITAMALVLLQIRDAIETGRPFDAEYQALVVLARDHPEIAAAATPLDGPAASGVASRAALTERLRQLAPQIATAKPPPKATWKSQIVARLRSLVTVRRIEGADQTPAEGAVGTAQRALASGDLAGAIAALDGLTGPSQAAAQPWLQMAKARFTVEAALRRAEAALTAAVGTATPAGKG